MNIKHTLCTAVTAALISILGPNVIMSKTYYAASETAITDLNLADGTYVIDAELHGGSGRAHIESPVQITVEKGGARATIVMSSEYYDYCILDGVTYKPVNTTGNSAFEVPLTAIGYEMPFQADTTAMSTPHLVDYTILMDADSLRPMGEENSSEVSNETASEQASEGTEENLAGAAESAAAPAENRLADRAIYDIEGLAFDHSMELKYADCFAVDYYSHSFKVLTILDEGSFLLVPEDQDIPDNLPDDLKVLKQPLENLYLVATSAMDDFVQIDGLSNITLSGTDADGWYIPEAKEAIENGSITYAGKYSAPDYERIVASGCSLAIESTMIYHNPEVREKLEEFGIPVMVEHSSYERHPLGREEWIRFYGALLNKEDTADAFFEKECSKLDSIRQTEELASDANADDADANLSDAALTDTGDAVLNDAAATAKKTVAIFAINSTGTVTVRTGNDYMAKMVELAGGTYIFENLLSDSNKATTNLSMEEFYAKAQSADVLIYNVPMTNEVQTKDQLMALNPLLADFKAVQDGHVWRTTANLFQKATGTADLILDIHNALADTQERYGTEEAADQSADTTAGDELTFMYRLK